MTVSAGDVKKLREMTGAGIMDCKRALEAAGGDVAKATEELRKMGKAAAKKKENREVRDGLVDAYIHPGNKIGVLIEVNCETDFVARTDEYRQLVRDLAMQVAAANPLALSREDLSPELIEKEKQIYREQARQQNKPEKIIEQIVNGRLNKFYQEVCLLEQPFIKDPDITVKDLITEKIAKLGENIQVRRFVRYALGE